MKNQNRDSVGRYAKSKKILGRVVWLAVLFSVAFLFIKIYINTHPVIKTVIETKTIDTSADMFASKIDSLEKSVVEAVRACESIGLKESDGLVTFDPTDEQFNSMTKTTITDNGEMSYGTLQFKKKTVQYYYKTLYKKDITGKEAILIALDDQKSGQLAQDIMFKSSNLANDWKNCANRLSLTDQIKAIKKIK